MSSSVAFASLTAALAAAGLATVGLAAAGCSKAEVRKDVPLSIEGANIDVGESTTNGLSVSKLSCKSEGGLLASMTLLGGLAARKDALAACSDKSEKVRVHFTYAGGKTTDIRVADTSTPAVARCVECALAGATLSDSGTCIATLAVGA